MRYEWDENKNLANQKKHGIPFELATRVFLDENRVEFFDEEHSTLLEERWGVIGRVERILVVIYTIRHEDTLRIITARAANREEEDGYYRGYYR